jgi:hypothetical protein
VRKTEETIENDFHLPRLERKKNGRKKNEPGQGMRDGAYVALACSSKMEGN